MWYNASSFKHLKKIVNNFYNRNLDQATSGQITPAKLDCIVNIKNNSNIRIAY